MIGIDTNILLRLVLDDSPDEADKAEALFATFTPERPGYVNLVTLNEMVWVLRRKIGLTRADVIRALRWLAESADLVLEGADQVHAAIGLMEAGPCEFADALIALRNAEAGCTRTFTFDRRAAGTVPGMELLA